MYTSIIELVPEGSKKRMTTVTVKEARGQLSDLINRAVYKKERVVVTRRGKGVVALIPLEDLLILEQMIEEVEDRIDAEAACKALEEVERIGTVPWENVKKALAL